MKPLRKQSSSFSRLAFRFPTGVGALLVGCLAWGFVAGPLGAAGPMTYRQARDFLAAHTKVLELTSDDGGRVAICPEYQARVMTTSCAGFDGDSLGWINTAFIEAGKLNRNFNNYGGEDRFWLAPEGGPYSLWFAPGAEQTLDNWYTPPAINEGAFQFDLDKTEPRYLLKRKVQVHNTAGTEFALDVERQIRILGQHHFAKSFGSKAAALVSNKKLKLIGFQTSNTVINRGAALSREKGLVSIWIAGMFPGGPGIEVIVPFKAGDDAKLGPAVTDDYFGKVPSDRLRIGEGAAYFRADGKFRSKIGTSTARAVPAAAALDRARGLLTLVHFDMPDEAQKFSYLDNHWQATVPEPYRGDVFNSYNDAAAESNGKSRSSFYELESVSPALELAPGKSLQHTHRTYHVQGDVTELVNLAEAALEIKLQAP